MKKIKGSCLCKKISFEIKNECRYSVFCHCQMCQASNAEFSYYTKVKNENLNFTKKVTGAEVAEKISKSLAKQAMVISVDGELKDLDYLIEKDCSVKIFTSKNPEGLETIRHDTAHILAMAVQELFPGTQVTIGPVIELSLIHI